jgi:hypothetical protein
MRCQGQILYQVTMRAGRVVSSSSLEALVEQKNLPGETGEVLIR